MTFQMLRSESNTSTDDTKSKPCCLIVAFSFRTFPPKTKMNFSLNKHTLKAYLAYVIGGSSVQVSFATEYTSQVLILWTLFVLP